MRDILWVIQDSDGKHYNWIALMKAIEECHSKGIFCKIENLKYLRNGFLNIMIGGDDFLEEAKKNPYIKISIMQDDSFFNIFNYKKIWGENFLNYNFKKYPFRELDFVKKGAFFARPMFDNKCFDGGIYKIPDQNFIINKECLRSRCKYWNQSCICLSEVQHIDFEWRVVVINSKIVTLCQYARKMNTCIDKNNIPDSLVEFCQKQICDVLSPPAWVVDIALVQNKYKILECNIFNASNFYDCNRKKIVISLEKMLQISVANREVKGL